MDCPPFEKLQNRIFQKLNVQIETNDEENVQAI